MEAINVKMKNRRQKSADSLKNIIPINTVPTAPIPVQTAYAVPNGNVCVAFISKPIDANKHKTKHPYQINDSVPDVSLAFPRLVVKPISKSPPKINSIQFIILCFDLLQISTKLMNRFFTIVKNFRY